MYKSVFLWQSEYISINLYKMIEDGSDKVSTEQKITAKIT